MSQVPWGYVWRHYVQRTGRTLALTEVAGGD